MIGALLNLINGPIGTIIDKVVPDKTLRDQLKHDLAQAALHQDTEFMKAASAIIIAEATGEGAAQRNWRPHLMYLIMALLVWNGVVVPLIAAFTGSHIPVLQAWEAIPEQMWTLLSTGLGGYIVGRSVEKSVAAWKAG